jgi:phospholipid/cholesterol/gamma-HCH transport system substrate-binding protein
MRDRTSENIKLGLFVALGFLLLVALLYALGANQNLFGKNYPLQVYFKNVSGLRSGNNVRYNGIDVGTVRQITIQSDTAVLVRLNVDEKIARFMKKNDLASIGTDGLMGNKLVLIEPGPPGGAPVERNDLLPSREALDMDEVMRTLDITNRNVAAMSEDLKNTVQRISQSTALWEILEDEALPAHIRATLANVRQASARADKLVADLSTIVAEVAGAEDGMIAMLKDTLIPHDIRAATAEVRALTGRFQEIGSTTEQAIQSLAQDLQAGDGPFHAALRDSTLTGSLHRSLLSIEEGTHSFNQSMEALQHSFLFRWYFRRLERQQAKSKQ